jgi:hypothetical protein
MALTGFGGSMRIARKLPEPVVIPYGEITFNSNTNTVNIERNTIYVRDRRYWTGDRVYVASPAGLPWDENNDGFADCNGFGAFHGSALDLGPNTARLNSPSSVWFPSSGPAFPQLASNLVTNSANVYIHRDRLDRVSFYRTRTAAMRGRLTDRIPLSAVDFGLLTLAPAGTAPYQNALLRCIGQAFSYDAGDIRDEVTLASICDFAPEFASPVAGTGAYNNADVVERDYIGEKNWEVVMELGKWDLKTSKKEVSTSAIGEMFGESLAAIITGGGTCDFFIEREKSTPGFSPLSLMRTVLVLEKAEDGSAQFIIDSNATNNGRPCDPTIDGSIFYETKILILDISTNTAAEDVIVGSMAFATFGEIVLIAGDDPTDEL